ncbi:MAG: electron transfer flavoprotein subunit alpha/FixB family protein [Deltaproteobacteria bacterium]|nr:electron transfer flavoprotein subunit alpha/FixB family protein [Deltaproteobacteria bacterium]MBW2724287.1 electron transfer flavoprotein subunit alpha/FixB family protein [Deltaproteobacteria bacterium]
MSSVLVVTEISNGSIRDTSLELVAFARKVAEASGREVKSLVIGSDVEGAAGDFASKGGGETYVVDAPEVANYNVECFKKAILAAVEAGGADLVLLSNTPLGWDVAPRIAASLDCAFVSDCTNIEASDSGLTFTRRVFNGKLDAQLSAAGPAVATVQSGACEPFSGSSEGSVTKLDADLSGAKAKFIEIKMSENTGIDLTKADVVVSGGRGVGDPDKFKEVIQPLADVLGGAMGASRPVVDAGWLPHAHQVGSSGQVVTPKLYIACGISGAIQHLVGMKGSNYIVAINKDADAPIFEVADVGVVADLFEVVPALTAALSEAKG